jgi:cell shape-determining protein MreC
MKKSLLIKKENSRHTPLRRKFFLVVIALFIGALMYIVVPKLVQGVTALVWFPLDTFRVWVAESGSSLPQYLRDRTALLGELEALKIKIATEQGTDNTIKKLQVENDELRELAGAVPEARVLARVIGRPGTLPYDIVMLDRGRAHGIVENTPVFLGADQVIGFVSKVQETTSFVTLVTTSGFTSTAYVIGPNIYTFAEGMGSGILRVRVPQGIMLRTGDMVLLPAIDSGVYGLVSYIETSATQPEQYGFVTTNIPTQSLYYVSVGKEPIVPHSFAEAEALVTSAKQTLFTVDVPLNMLVTPETSSSSIASSTATTTSSTSISQ